MAEPKGIAFPFRFGAHGHLRRAEGTDKIKGNLRSIVITALGSRPMEPNSGSIGPDGIFRNATFALVPFLAQQLASGEPRALIDDIQVIEEDPTDPGSGTATIHVSFRIEDTGQTDHIQITR